MGGCAGGLQLRGASPGLLGDDGSSQTRIANSRAPRGEAAGRNRGRLEGCGSLAQVTTLLPTIAALVKASAQGEQI